jgi:fimbrial chaperone protein
LRSIILLALVFVTTLPQTVVAASLQVSPVSFDLPATASATQLTLRNLGEESINVQIRVFRWSQEDGEEVLTPTTDLVVSPPAASLEPGQNHIVRLVRTSNQPVTGEESYRLLIDELPQPRETGQSTVSFVFRYSMPVFFSEDNAQPELSWQTLVDGDKLVVRAQNAGTRHVRLSGLQLTNASGESLSLAKNLAGYVLPDSSLQWSTPLPESDALAPGSDLAISASGRNGEIHAIVKLQSAGN